jgi:hypothetical protein
VIANAGNVPASNVRVFATLTPVTTAPKGHSSGHQSTTTTLAGPPTHASTAGRIIGSLGAGRSIYISLPPLACRSGVRYVLRIKVGSDVESITLQVAAG